MRMTNSPDTPSTFVELEYSREFVYNGHLILVNRNHPFHRQTIRKAAISPSELKTFQGQIVELEQTCSHQLSSLIRACRAEGKLVAVSGIRSEEEQRLIYNDSVRVNGLEFTRKYVASPSESEHHTGLAIDLAEDAESIDYICPSFPDTGICRLVKQKAESYGFVQRYQEGKAGITGISPEPWHYRFVGTPHAVLMNQNGLCFEEYIEFLRRFPVDGSHLMTRDYNRYVEIYFVEVTKQTVKVPVPVGKAYQVSGNNVDGLIVTVFHEGDEIFGDGAKLLPADGKG
jgi:zinc D-Ala-D-Ala dipeptidase/carboxypeptidase